MGLAALERDGAVATVTLNRPDAMNALSHALRNDLAEAIDTVAADSEVRVLILTGAGERAFSAGLDLKELGQFGLSLSPDGVRARHPVARLRACEKPIIGAINGVALTGGFELALACDVLIASTQARFADTHVRVGVTPGSGLSQHLSRRIGISRAMEISLTGNFINADTALAWGLVNRVVPPAELMPAARKLAAEIASCDPDMVRRYKALIQDGYALSFGQGMALERERAGADNAKVTAKSVAEVRSDVQARGRAQEN